VRRGKPDGSRNGDRGEGRPLHEGEKTTCGSRILEDFVSLTTRRPSPPGGEDAVLIGKTHGRIRHGVLQRELRFGPFSTRWTRRRSPEAPAADRASPCRRDGARALGTTPADPSGSRGVLRNRRAEATYGRVSARLVALSSSLIRSGHSRTRLADAARVLQVIAGHDPHDSTSGSPVPTTPLP